MPNDEQDRQFVLEIFKSFGKEIATKYEEQATDMTPNEIHKSSMFFPDFNPEKQYLNYKPGFVCKSPLGNLVKLVQPYDSTIYTNSPEELSAQWGFYWSTDPKYAKPFIALATSPYSKDDCCIFKDNIYRSLKDNNVFEPESIEGYWEIIAPVSSN